MGLYPVAVCYNDRTGQYNTIQYNTVKYYTITPITKNNMHSRQTSIRNLTRKKNQGYI